MIAYIIRRILYAIPILIGVNVLTFMLFFVVNTPDDMARMRLGMKHVTPEAVEKWKHERGYDKPLLFSSKEAGMAKVTDTIFLKNLLGYLCLILVVLMRVGILPMISANECGPVSQLRCQYFW